MIIGKVIGTVVSTRKAEILVGNKFMMVQHMENGKAVNKFLVAVDNIGAGIGETVLVVQGSGARLAVKNVDSPIDAAIIGIVDQ